MIGLINIFIKHGNCVVNIEKTDINIITQDKISIRDHVTEKLINNIVYDQNGDALRQKRSSSGLKTRIINTNQTLPRYNNTSNGKYVVRINVTQNNGNLKSNTTSNTSINKNMTRNNGTNKSGINGNRYPSHVPFTNATIKGYPGYNKVNNTLNKYGITNNGNKNRTVGHNNTNENSNILNNHNYGGYNVTKPGYNKVNNTLNRYGSTNNGNKNITSGYNNANKNSNVLYNHNYGGYNVTKPGYYNGKRINSSKPANKILTNIPLPYRPVNYTGYNNNTVIVHRPNFNNTTTPGFKHNPGKTTPNITTPNTIPKTNRMPAINNNLKNTTLPGFNAVNGPVSNPTGTETNDTAITKKKATASEAVVNSINCSTGTSRIYIKNMAVCVPDNIEDYLDEDER